MSRQRGYTLPELLILIVIAMTFAALAKTAKPALKRPEPNAEARLSPERTKPYESAAKTARRLAVLRHD